MLGATSASQIRWRWRHRACFRGRIRRFGLKRRQVGQPGSHSAVRCGPPGGDFAPTPSSRTEALRSRCVVDAPRQGVAPSIDDGRLISPRSGPEQAPVEPSPEGDCRPPKRLGDALDRRSGKARPEAGGSQASQVRSRCVSNESDCSSRAERVRERRTKASRGSPDERQLSVCL